MNKLMDRWFFEFLNSKNHLEEENNKDKNSIFITFSKEELIKYYFLWSNEPFIIMKGIYKVLEKYESSGIVHQEDLNTNDLSCNFIEIFRARIIFFQSLYKMCEEDKNIIGTIKNAVITYAVSILYSNYDGNIKSDFKFDFINAVSYLPKDEEFQENLKELLIIVNEYISCYCKGKILSECLKEKDFFIKLNNSSQITAFFDSEKNKSSFNKYLTLKES